MRSIYHPDFKVGILGGGQLGRMLLQEAPNLDLKLYIMDPDPNAPCHQLAHDFVCGDINDFDTVYQFGKEMDVITIEIEHVNVDALEKLASEGIKVFPQPHVIRTVQNKGQQKTFYKENGIPTAPFKFIQDKTELSEQDLPCVQKLFTGGYDGRGVQVLRTAADLDKAFDAPSVLEELIDFEKELSVIVSRNEKGEVATFPLVELEFNPEANLVEFLFSPAEVSAAIEDKARHIAEDVIEKIDMVGLLAVELFLTKEGEVLVNEIAPRPHNSGHQTIEGNITSQYEQHLRSILNLPPGDTAIRSAAVMVNILGEAGQTGPVRYDGLEEILSWSGVYPHIYGKTTVKPFRKMGHVTIIHEELTKAKALAQQVKDTLKAMAE